MADRDLVALAQHASEVLLKIPGVHAVGVGVKETGGQRTDELSIRVFVTSKRPLGDVPEEQRIPSEIDGVKTDVVEEDVPVEGQVAGALAEREDGGSYRPLKGGIQIVSTQDGGHGTLGCFARVAGQPNTVVAITCHHVVSDGTASPIGHDEVGQPTDGDGCSGCCSDIIGTVLDDVYDPDVDVALIKLNPGTKWLAEVLDVGVVAGVHDIVQAEIDPPQPPYQVRKRGRTTRLTGGVVTDIGVTGTIKKADGTVKRSYVGAIRTVPNPDPAHPGEPTIFSAPGDSGAAVINAAGEVVGIHFSSTGTSARAQPVGTITAKFATGVPASRRLTLTVATAAAPGAVQTIPIVGEAPVREPMIPDADRRRLDDDLRRAPLLRWYVELMTRHQSELTGLINTNRRAATAWHRSGAAELAQALFRAFRYPNVTVPKEVRGRSLAACLDEALAALDRYGSPALKADAHAVAATIPDVAGLTYLEALDVIAARPAPFQASL